MAISVRFLGPITVTIYQGMDMADMAEVRAALDDIEADNHVLNSKFDLVMAKVQELRDQILAGGGVAAADLQEILDRVQAADVETEAMIDKADQALNPPPP